LPQTESTIHAMGGSNDVENVVIAGAGPAGLMLA
jgi:NADPH-dependent 2,4-dienoyl-CoA reductase/sulfur reductase-like enzyme